MKTDAAATTKRERRKWIRRLQNMEKRSQSTGDRQVDSTDRSVRDKGYAAHDDAYAVRKALGYVERHVNLSTGELTISLSEPAEVEG